MVLTMRTMRREKLKESPAFVRMMSPFREARVGFGREQAIENRSGWHK
jgi:hypothetical protein